MVPVRHRPGICQITFLFTTMNNSKKTKLNSLAELAVRHACEELAKDPRIAPAYFYVGECGQSLAITPPFQSDEEKNRFIEGLRILAVAEKATAGVLVVDCWLKFLDGQDNRNSGGQLSQDPDRKECVLLSGEAQGTSLVRYYPILRSQNGKFTGLGEPMILDVVECGVVKILPAREPDAAAQLVAKALLGLPATN